MTLSAFDLFVNTYCFTTSGTTGYRSMGSSSIANKKRSLKLRIAFLQIGTSSHVGACTWSEHASFLDVIRSATFRVRIPRWDAANCSFSVC